jgi:negative regulator of sigma E activity
MKRRWIICVSVGLLVLGSGVYVTAVLTRPNPWLAVLAPVTRAPETQSFRGTVVMTSMVGQEPVRMKFDITHRAPDQTDVSMQGWNCGGGEWGSPEKWFGRWTGKKSKDWMKDWGQGSQGWGTSWWRGCRENFVRPILDPRAAVENYEIGETAGEPLAGRDVRAFHFVPKQPGRPQYKLRLDRATNIALGLEVIDASGRTITRWVYETFEPGKIPEQTEPHKEWWPGTSQSLTIEQLQASPPFEVWLPRRLPAGFSFHSARLKTWQSFSSVTLSYTDGVAVISITQSVGDWPWKKWSSMWRKEAPMEPVSEMGEPPVVRRWSEGGTVMLKTELGKTHISIMGMIPGDELTDMVRTMTRVGD